MESVTPAARPSSSPPALPTSAEERVRAAIRGPHRTKRATLTAVAPDVVRPRTIVIGTRELDVRSMVKAELSELARPLVHVVVLLALALFLVGAGVVLGRML